MTTTERELDPGPVVAVDAFTAMVQQHWPELVRLAALLLRDRAQAEDVVQDAVVACFRARDRVRDPAAALAYLRRAVVNSARSSMRRSAVALRHRQPGLPDAAGADDGALAALERDEVIAALKRLPRRQREALVLRFYADATERDAATAMGVSVGSVKGYTSRGLAALQALLEEEQ